MGQVINTINLGEYQLYGDLNARRAALNGPIIVGRNSINFSRWFSEHQSG
jgi:hypothetical protein